MARILVVDDSFTARSILGKLLGDRHELAGADSGQAALATLEAKPFDLVLLDLLMPGMDGFQTLDAIKRLRPALPVLIVSADIQLTTRARVLAAGAVDLVNKPAKREQLLAAVEEALRG